MTRSLRTPLAHAAALSLALLAAPALAQITSGDPVNGKYLFEETGAASGNNDLGSCTNCHGNVQERRAAIAGSSALSPAISYDTAISELGSAIGRVPGMAQFQALAGEDIADIAAYLADTPKASVTTLAFTATAVNTVSAAQPVRITAPMVSNGALRITNIAIAGTGAAKFSRTYNCDNKTFAAAESCELNVTFSPKDTTNANPVLTITMNEGTSIQPITRRVTLNGTVSATTPTPPTSPNPPAADDESGGGAIGWGWLLAMAGATLALGGRRRRG